MQLISVRCAQCECMLNEGAQRRTPSAASAAAAVQPQRPPVASSTTGLNWQCLPVLNRELV